MYVRHHATPIACTAVLAMRYIWMYMSFYKFLTRNNIPKAIPFSVSASVSQIICQAMWPSAFVVVVQRQGDGAGVLRFWAYVPRQKLLCHAYLEIHLEVSTVTYRYSGDSWVPATYVKTDLEFVLKSPNWHFFLATIFYHSLLTFDRFFCGELRLCPPTSSWCGHEPGEQNKCVAKAEVLGNFAWKTHVRKLPGSGERPKACHAQRSNGSCFLGGTLFMLCRFLLSKAMSAIIGCLWSWTNTWVECLCLPGTSPALVHWSHSATCHRNWLSVVADFSEPDESFSITSWSEGINPLWRERDPCTSLPQQTHGMDGILGQLG